MSCTTIKHVSLSLLHAEDPHDMAHEKMWQPQSRLWKIPRLYHQVDMNFIVRCKRNIITVSFPVLIYPFGNWNALALDEGQLKIGGHVIATLDK